MVQARALRVVLFSDAETTVCLSREAVDFYDWISHRIDCPAGPPAFAVRALRRAALERAPAVIWRGGDLDGTFAGALPGRHLVRMSAAQPYAALVEALRPRARTWVAAIDLDGPTRLRWVRWAAAEAGRRGMLILVEPKTEPASLPVAHARALAVEDATGRLREAGIKGATRLAALLELEPQAIADAADSGARGSRGGGVGSTGDAGRGPGCCIGAATGAGRGRGGRSGNGETLQAARLAGTGPGGPPTRRHRGRRSLGDRLERSERQQRQSHSGAGPGTRARAQNHGSPPADRGSAPIVSIRDGPRYPLRAPESRGLPAANAA